MAEQKHAFDNRKWLGLNVLAVVFALVVSIVFLGIYLQVELNQSMRQSTEVTFSAVYDAVNNKFDEVTDISDSIRNDPFLIDAIEHENDDQDGFLQKATSYLADIAQRYDLSTAYLVTDENMRYYLPDGSVKVLDPEQDEWDSWYTALVESDDDYHVDVDVDKHNTNKWTIFVDWRITNAQGKTLGVVGAGIDMDDLMEIARYYTGMFDMNVSFVNENGLTYVGASASNVAEAQRDVAAQGNDEAVTTTTLNSCTVSRYIPLIGWYLSVENNGAGLSQSMFGLIVLSVVLLSVSLILILVLNSRMFSNERNRLANRANSDSLTGLLNRAGLEQKAAEYFNAEEGVRPSSLIAIDVDHFKDVNDTFGHAVGDQALRDVAATLRGVFRESDVLARPGGDEFIAFLPAMEPGEVLELRTRTLSERGRRTYTDEEGHEVQVTLSMGVASAPKDATSFEELSKAADAALYEAKRAGRDCYRFA